MCIRDRNVSSIHYAEGAVEEIGNLMLLKENMQIIIAKAIVSFLNNA